jgi:AraC-like DNA-binding protein
VGFLQVSTVSGPARTLALSPGAGELLVGVHLHGRAGLVRPGRDEPYGPDEPYESYGPDELFFCDGPVTLHEQEDFALRVVQIPRRALALSDLRIRALVGRGPRSGGQVAALLAPVLRALPDAADGCSPRTALHLAGNVTELVGALAVEDTAPRFPEPAEPFGHARDRVDLTRRLYAHIDENLGNRDLSPASVAAALHISIRYLHKLFAGHGSTVGRWIQHRRLEEARRELARPGGGTTGVAAVAARWGFAGAAHFSRSFRRAYGMSPSDWRDARTGPPPDITG